MDPSTHRVTTSALAEKSQGRCFSVRYRLSPQNVFPAALLDAFVSYLALLSPPTGSFHEAIPASSIVIAGDSSGACLATSLLLLLLTLRRINVTHIRFHGKDVDISGENGRTEKGEFTGPEPPVAGLAITSPWLDVSRSLPSVHRNAKWDIIDPPSELPDHPVPNFPDDSIWPVDPPRVETYCEARIVSHPLVSPLAAHSKRWEGAPPVYINVGWEAMQDEAEVLARRLHDCGVAVKFEEYIGMPHCFAMLPWNEQGRVALTNWARFCRDASSNVIEFTDYGTWTDKHRKVGKTILSDLGKLGTDIKDHRELDNMVEEAMAKQRKRRIRLEEKMRCVYREGTLL
jgi:acetyl esterase/lipase